MRHRKAVFTILFSGIVIFLFISVAFPQLEEDVQVRILEVWVKVTDGSSRPNMNLAPEDFSLLVDGRELQIRCFDKLLDQPPDSEVTNLSGEDTEDSAKTNKRKFVFFFDLLNSTADDIKFLKKPVKDFIMNSFRETDEGMAFVLLPNYHLGVVQKPTSDRYALIDVIGRMRGNPSLENKFVHNQRQLTQLLYGGVGARSSANLGARSLAGVSLSSEQIRQARHLAGTFADEEQRVGKTTLASFLSIGEYLKINQMQGHVVLIFVSGGFPLLPGLSYYELLNKAVEETFVAGGEDLQYRDLPDIDFVKEIKKTIGILNRMNVTIYSIDSRGLAVNNHSVEYAGTEVQGVNLLEHHRNFQDSIVQIAKETGGLAFINSQNFNRGLQQITEDMSQQYWLCANLPPAKKPGTYHKIEVKLNKPGFKVRHRTGYVD